MIRSRYFVICLSFSSILLTNVAMGAEKAAAIVNGEAIAMKAVSTIIEQAPTPLMPLTSSQKKQQQVDAVNLLIDDLLIRQFLRENGPKIDPGEVEKQFAALEQSQKELGKTVKEFLKEIGQTEVQIRENIRLMLQLAKYTESQISKEKLQQFFETNRDFFEKTTVKVSHIVVRVTPDALPDEKKKAREKLLEIRGEIREGKMDFAKAAKTYSQCPSAPEGGNLGFICRKFQVDETFAQTAFALKVNEVSNLVETEHGYHLIKVVERKAGTPVKFEEIIRDVRECYEAEFKHDLLTQLKKKAKIEIKLQ